jgi:Mg-chelatase subunit ChlD
MMPWVLALALMFAGYAQQQPPAQPAAQKPAEAKPDAKAAGTKAADAKGEDGKPAETEEQNPSFGISTNLVSVPFTVLDLKDRMVTDLKQENFKVYEDGRPVQIRFFTALTKVPLRVALLIDTSNSVRLYFKQQQEAAIDFIHNITEGNSKNLMFLMSFDFTKDFITDFSSDADMMAGKVRKLKPGGGTALHDAIVLACRERLAKQVEVGGLRRVAVLITDGEDDTSKYSLDEAISVARQSGVIIYAIATVPYGYTGEGEKALEKLTEATGGRVVYPWKKPPSADYATGYLSRTQIDGQNSVYGLGTGQYSSETAENLAAALGLIQRELQMQYNLYYMPPNPNPDGKFHKIRLELNVDGLRVRSRPGYYPPMYQ